ncbi:AAA family ATPase [Calycomorphotria hydatis]|uniref:CobQ/CobB/MinD/ParA nucleotide binding domain protein n=1 Tax=Calycomorphotria hydatis TaxID=2528027 RepID=A0A517T7Z1_9PLAN|nr:response regulator [Calycomorphotria hydatis]QDT64470.1 CobQ/CobB/MinD/ParA nucleotide binding domain protein [Calycomorphotria hydatis]
MKSVVRLAIVDPNDSSRSAIKNLLLGIDMVWLEAECSRYEYFSDVVMQTQPDIALVSLDADSSKALALVARLSQDLPNCAILVISNSQEGSLILQAMRNGAKEFLSYPPKLEDFLAALDRIKQQSGAKEGDGRVRGCQVLTVAGVGGGIGCTSMAINLACSLAQNERNAVALLDLDFALGDADVWLDIIPDYTIQDVADNISRLDYSLLKRSLTKHDCGAFLLPRPSQMEANGSINAEDFRRVAALLKATFTHLVIDVSKSYSPLDLAAMEISDAVLMVTQLDLPSLRNVVRLTQFFDQDESLSEKLKIVVNRIGLEDNQISLNKALETIGREIFWEIPNDYATMVESRNNGIPLLMQAPKAKLTRSIEQLAMKFDHAKVEVNGDVDAEKKKSKGLFRFLGSGQKS